MGEEQERPKWIWCLVGNVVKERLYGPNHEVRRGTKRFAPGTKVYCYPVKWGDGYERIYVLGKPREKYDLIRLIMPRKYIENFRLQKVYNPQVIERMNPSPDSDDYVDGWDDSDFDRMQIKDMLKWLNLSDEENDRRFTMMRLCSLVLESRIEGCPEGSVSLRIERRYRTDSLYGGAWYGYCSIGSEPEREIGMLDWYGTWPDGTPYVFGRHIHDDMDLAFGLCDAGIHLWEEVYDAQRTTEDLVIPGASGLAKMTGHSLARDETHILTRFHRCIASLQHGGFLPFGIRGATPRVPSSSTEPKV